MPTLLTSFVNDALFDWVVSALVITVFTPLSTFSLHSLFSNFSTLYPSCWYAHQRKHLKMHPNEIQITYDDSTVQCYRIHFHSINTTRIYTAEMTRTSGKCNTIDQDLFLCKDSKVNNIIEILFLMKRYVRSIISVYWYLPTCVHICIIRIIYDKIIDIIINDYSVLQTSNLFSIANKELLYSDWNVTQANRITNRYPRQSS